MIDPIDDGLLDRYVAGECSPPEIERVLQWIGDSAERQARIGHARALSHAVRSINEQWDVDQAWARAQSVMHSAEPSPQCASLPTNLGPQAVDRHGALPVLPDVRVRRSLSAGYALAAAACLVVGVAIVTWRELTMKRPFIGASESIATGPRQRVNVQLRDGSRVILGPESRLVEAPQFGIAVREVDLVGAAYFDIVHDAARPFVVVTHTLRIQDLGTRFSVDAYVGDPRAQAGSDNAWARVAVTAGSVALEPVRADRSDNASSQAPPRTDTPVILRAGTVGRLDALGRISVVRPTSIGQYVSWTSGELTLDDVSLGEAVRRLEHWYGVTIALGDPRLACRHITASFHDEPLADVLAELSLALHLRHVDAGGSVRLEDAESLVAGGGPSDQQSGSLQACPAQSVAPPAERSR